MSILTSRFKSFIRFSLFIFLSFAHYAFAYTLSWKNTCDFNWNNSTVNFTGENGVSPLDLLNNDQEYQQPVQVWCKSIPDDTSDKQHVSIVVDSQTSQGSALNMSPINSKSTNSHLPFKICTGHTNDNQLCMAAVGQQETYNWGNDGSAAFAPIFFHVSVNGDPNDPCSEGKSSLPNSNCADTVAIGKGPYSNVGELHIITDHAQIAANPPAPGVYQDTISTTISGALDTGWWFPLPGGVDLSTNSPTLILKAVLKPDCRIMSVPDVKMQGSFSNELNQTQSISVQCTKTTPYTLAFSGLNDEKGWHQMKSSSGKTLLHYQIYSNPEHTTVMSPEQTYTGTGLQQKISTYYATDPSQENVSAGTYHDTVTLTVTY